MIYVERNEAMATKTKRELTFRVSEDYLAQQERILDIATRVFFGATIAFIALMLAALIFSVPILGDVAIGVAFFVWFPSLIVAAFAAKRFIEGGGYFGMM